MTKWKFSWDFNMNIYGWLQLTVFIVILLILTKPMGVYLTQVLDPEGKTFLDPVLRPVEGLFYRLFGLEHKKGTILAGVHAYPFLSSVWSGFCLRMPSFACSISCL